MKTFLFFLLFMGFLHQGIAQRGYLFVKKGAKKVRTYEEGDRIRLLGHDGYLYTGVITLLRNDTIYLNGLPLARTEVERVLLGRKKQSFRIDPKQMLLITGGVVLVTGGLSLSKQAKFGEAAIAGATIGYGPLLISYLGSKISLKRKKYKIGRRYRLQVLDFYLPYKAF
ncbi:MAG: hypothetical protein EOO05_02055 [Chitinophagaceae bacterium]|nr:MAG: hypothetical protein EOO05_02055 [Chitinophagaceae bacterium]